MAMIIAHAGKMGYKHGGKKIRDVVLTVPPYADFKYRLSLKNAVELAGLSPLAFIHENTAAALFYGLDRVDNETHRVIFYNMGSSSLKVSLVEYGVSNNTKRIAKSKAK